jgi:hypothetical protein
VDSLTARIVAVTGELARFTGLAGLLRNSWGGTANKGYTNIDRYALEAFFLFGGTVVRKTGCAQGYVVL